ncbi:MAG: 2Fe-2S ferredoxin [Gammaproteobacteria bacterium]|nr:2Fe-2S ferredoxin [Gammaproteobacteria bacterium]
MAFEKICTLDDVWEGDMASFETSDGTGVLVVFASGGELKAFQSLCPHQGFELIDGKLEGHVLTCTAHLWEFDVRSGKGVNPMDCRLTVYPTKIEGNDVYVDVTKVAPFDSYS